MLTVTNSDKDGFLKELFKIHDDRSMQFLDRNQIQRLYSDVRIGGLSISQVVASMEYVCGSADLIGFSDLKELIEELDRRYFLVQDLQWEFALLDNLHTGFISPEKAEFLFRAVHGSCFSPRKWEVFVRTRPVPFGPLSFADIEVELCNKPRPDDFDFDGVEKDIPLYKSPQTPVISKKALVVDFTSKKKAKSPVKQQQEVGKARDDEGVAAKHAEEEAARKRRDEEEAERVRSAAAAEEEEREKKREEEGERRAREKADAEERARKRLEREERKRAKREARRAERAEMKAKVTEEKERLRYDVEDAMDARERHLLEPAIDAYKKVVTKPASDELLKRAERLLEVLKAKDELKDASARRVIEDLERVLKKVKAQGFHKSEDELEQECEIAEELFVRLKRLERLRAEVLELKQSTIAEIRSYQKPIPIIHSVMTSTYLLLGVSEKETKKWQSVQTLLGKTGKEGLKRRISQRKITDITPEVATRVRHILGDADLESIRDVSAGAATFFVWTEGMVDEVLSDS